MPPILTLKDLSKSYGSRPLFENLNVSIEAGERIGLIGPNGAGKSTLLRIIAGNVNADEGDVATQRGLRIAFMEQVPAFKTKSTVLESILEGSAHSDEGSSLTLAYELISKLSLDGSEKISSETLVDHLSGGWKKRVALARELMREPDLLLLDEPTNHLDVESILWLEDFIKYSSFATITITHDRYFLQRVANRILELDKRNPSGLLSVKGHYEDYLEAKEELIKNQEIREQSLRNTLRREVEWLRSGVKARGTKQQARIKRAGELAEEVSELQYRNSTKTVGIEFEALGHHPKKLLEAKNISKSISDRVLFENLNLILSPGSRIGLLGPNGCGKSTLIRVLLHQQKSEQGEVFHSDQLKIAYFEQNRESLDPKQSLIKAMAQHGDQVIYRGNAVNVRAYLDRFLFTQAQMNMSVGQLSGGEQSRLLVARLMLQDANLLVLDEPTNDLDLETLAILEDCLTEFEGAVLLVTHDRFFLDRVSTQILAFHPMADGRTEMFASLDQWQAWHALQIKGLNNNKKSQKTIPNTSAVQNSVKKKLSFKEQRELDLMETNIQKIELELEKLNTQIQLPEVAVDAAKLLELSEMISATQAELDRLYTRWAELEENRKL